ncbi:MAG: hypothetical protein NTU73_04055 [Ignavibacteriae bacterium]|nr:hypothetical protein [Ignavibacteriota bacterium]
MLQIITYAYMFEEIVEKKYRPLKALADELKIISSDTIKNSDLSLFAINFLTAEQTEINDRDLLNSLLEKSVKLSVNYSLRPKWTIVNYLFSGYDSKPADEILRKAEVFRFYRYYIDLIINHIKDNALMFITQDEVNYLADEANKVVLEKLVKNTSSVKIKNFFSQIYKLKYGDDKEINLDWSVPYLFIKLFLEDKGFQELLDKFKIIPGLDDTMEIEMKTAIKILTDKYYVNNDFFILKDEPQNVNSETLNGKNDSGIIIKEEKEIIRESKTEITENTAEEKTPFATEKSKPEEDEKPKGIIRIIKNIPTKRFHKEKKTTEEKIIPVENKKESTEEKTGEQVETGQVFVKRERASDEEKIKHIFKKEEINIIQKKVFKGSKSAMYEAFDELEKFNTWQDASGFLKEIFLKNKVDLYNKNTVLFVDLLNDYFIKIEKGK